MNKRGIELSVNFLVMLILAIVVFGFGLKIVYSMFSSSMKKIEGLDQNTEQQIMSMLSSGQKVAIPIYKKTTVRGKPVVFGVGVYNSLEGPSVDDEFVVRVGDVSLPGNQGQIKARYFTIDGVVGTANDKVQVVGNYKVNVPKTTEPIKIQKNKGTVITIPIQVDKNAPAGTYVFDVMVCPKRDPSWEVFAYGSLCNARVKSAGGSDNAEGLDELYDQSTHQITIEVK